MCNELFVHSRVNECVSRTAGTQSKRSGRPFDKDCVVRAGQQSTDDHSHFDVFRELTHSRRRQTLARTPKKATGTLSICACDRPWRDRPAWGLQCRRPGRANIRKLCRCSSAGTQIVIGTDAIAFTAGTIVSRSGRRETRSPFGFSYRATDV